MVILQLTEDFLNFFFCMWLCAEDKFKFAFSVVTNAKPIGLFTQKPIK